MSDMQSADEAESPVLVKNMTVDAIVAVVLFVIATVVVIEARRLGSGWTTDGPGSGYFPFYIGLILGISALGIFYQAVFGKSRDSGTFVDHLQAKRVLSVLLPAAVYVLAIVFLGFYVASALYILLFMIILGKYPPLKSLMLAVVINVFFFLLFEVWFKLPLYKGTLAPLSFLGY